jgi:hypothetical protein
MAMFGARASSSLMCFVLQPNARSVTSQSAPRRKSKRRKRCTHRYRRKFQANAVVLFQEEAKKAQVVAKKQEAELRSYKSVMNEDEMTSNADVHMTAEEFEEDFM